MIKQVFAAVLVASSLLFTSCASDRQVVKKISIMGDSYSTFKNYIPEDYAWWYAQGVNEGGEHNDVKEVNQTWWKLLTDTDKYSLEVNDSYSGSTICTTGYDAKDSTHSAFVTRYKRLGHPDIILIFGATNDSWANSPIGEYKYQDISQEDKKAFRPALAFLLTHIKDYYKKAEVYYILNSELKDEINESVHTICAHYNVPIISLHDIDKQYGHPSIVGMQAIYKQVDQALSTLHK